MKQNILTLDNKIIGDVVSFIPNIECIGHIKIAIKMHDRAAIENLLELKSTHKQTLFNFSLKTGASWTGTAYIHDLGLRRGLMCISMFIDGQMCISMFIDGQKRTRMVNVNKRRRRKTKT